MKSNSLKNLFSAGRKATVVALLAGCMMIASHDVAWAVPPEIDYQAQILDSFSGDPITSTDVTITLRLYPSSTSSIPLRVVSYSNLDLSGTDGFVNLQIDATGINLNGDVYAELTVDDNTDSQPAETLLPRQKLNSVPFALNTATLEGDSLAAVRAYADNAANTAESDANAYADTVAAQALADANAYTDAEIAALSVGGAGVENFNRVVFVNAAATQSATPNGQLNDPFDNLIDAYAYAKTLPSAGSFFDRIAIYVMPGQHELNTTLVMDTVGIDLVGFGSGQAFIRGTADPMIQYTAPTSGAWMDNLNIRPSGPANVALEALAGGRVTDCVFNRPTSAGPTQGTLITINVPNGASDNFSLSFNGFEIYGDVTVDSYGDQTAFSNGFILGDVTSTATVGTGGTEFISFVNMSTIGGIDFQPAGASSGIPGILSLGNVNLVGAITYDPDTVLQAFSTNFVDLSGGVPLTLPEPNFGTYVLNCFGTGTGAWVPGIGTVTNSPGNTPFHISSAAKTIP